MKTAEIKKQWLLQNEKICLCKAIPRKQFTAAIRSGATSVEEINKIVGSGSGDCKGERCGPKIEQLLKDLSDSTERKQ
jgi:bacterioferritin-associated ferredoxin